MNSTWKHTRIPGFTSRKSRNFMTNRSSGKNFESTRKCCKLHSRWDGPFVITNVFPYGAVELKDEHTNSAFQDFQTINWY
ncbi:hypothetical protein CR513_21260, partial [Mucuna pruriens]